MQRQNFPIRWPDIVAVTLGGLVAGWGLLTLVGGQIHNVALLQILPAFASMQDHPAFRFLACSTGLIAFAAGWRRLALGCAVSRQAYNEMEQRVQERTAELVDVTARLHKERAERKQAEESLRESEKRLSLLSEVAAERDRTEEALRQSDESLRRMMESSPDCIKLLDLDAHLLFMTEGGKCVMEIDDFAPFKGKAWLPFWKDNDRQAAEAAVALAKAGETGRFQGFCPTSKGTPKWWDVIVTALFDAGQKPMQLLAVSRDITGEKRLSEQIAAANERLTEINEQLEVRVEERTAALRDSEAQLRLVLDTAPAVVAYVDSEQRYHFSNRPYTERWGLSPEAILGKRVEEVLGPAAYEVIRPHIEAALAGQAVTYETAIPYPDIGKRYMHVNYVPDIAADGKINGFVVMASDITERRETEEALRESVAVYRFLADAMPQIVWTARPDGNPDYYNQRWFDYTGLTLAETKGWGWKPVLHEEDLQNCIDRWTQAYTTGEPYEVEYRFRRAEDGAYRWHLGRALPRRNSAGEIVQWVGTCTDIDDFKRTQAALKSANADLEQRIQQRTAELIEVNRNLQAQVQERERAEKVLQEDAERLAAIIATQYAIATAGRDLDTVLNLIVERTQKLTDASGGVIEMAEGDEMVYRAASGTVASHVGLRLKIETSLSGKCVQTGTILRCDDAETDPRMDRAACQRIAVRSMIVVPLYQDGQAHGVLKVVSPAPQAFRERDISTLQLMAGLISAAISNGAAFEAKQALIIERTAALTTLQESEERFQAFMNNSPAIAFMKDALGRYVYINAEYERLFHQSLADIRGRTDFDLFAEEVARSVRENDWATLAAGKTIEVLETIPTPNGQPHSWLGYKFPFTDAAAQRFLGGIAIDITERNQAEQALREYAERLAAIVTTQQEVATAGLDLNDVMQLVSERAQALAGAEGAGVALVEEEAIVYRAATGTGTDYLRRHIDIASIFSGLCERMGDSLHCDDTQTDPRVDPEASRELGIRSMILVPMYQDRRVIGVLVVHASTPHAFGKQHVSTLQLMAGLLAAAIGYALAFEAKQALIRERTAALSALRASEQTLQKQARELARSNEELEQFAYVASHDMQEPLRKIQTFSGRLKDKYSETLGEQGRDYLQRMHNSAHRMQTLIQDLLTFSRLTTKLQPFVPVDLNEVAREVVIDLEACIEQAGGRVEMGSLPTIDADPLQMRQLLQNLIGNGLKYRRPEEAPVVTVRAQPLPDPAADPSAPGTLCQILVTDNGIGFDEKYLDRIFAPFQRLHGRNDYEGTGMGLAICRKVAERHNGTITARSMPGQGSTFMITLPLKQARGVQRDKTES